MPALVFDHDEGFDDGTRKEFLFNGHCVSHVFISTSRFGIWLPDNGHYNVAEPDARRGASGPPHAGNWCGVKILFQRIHRRGNQKHTVKRKLFSTEPKIQDLIALYALVSRIRVLCSQEIVARAEKGHNRNNRHLLYAGEQDGPRSEMTWQRVGTQ